MVVVADRLSALTPTPTTDPTTTPPTGPSPGEVFAFVLSFFEYSSNICHREAYKVASEDVLLAVSASDLSVICYNALSITHISLVCLKLFPY